MANALADVLHHALAIHLACFRVQQCWQPGRSDTTFTTTSTSRSQIQTHGDEQAAAACNACTKGDELLVLATTLLQLLQILQLPCCGHCQGHGCADTSVHPCVLYWQNDHTCCCSCWS
jgi:hypothetical protein